MSGFTKLFSSITDSTIWREPDKTRLVWITMLAMADQNGVVSASVPGLADRARVPLDDCVAALDAFMAPDKWSRSKEYEGRRIAEVDGGWVLLNHAKYRAVMDAEKRREQSRLAMQRLRAERGAVSTVNTGERRFTQAEAEAEISKPSVSHPRSGGFAGFWKDWPKSERKQDKAKCAAYWKLHNLDTVIDAIAGDVRTKRATTKWTDGFIEAPLVYLRGRRWEDGVTPDEGKPGESVTDWRETKGGVQSMAAKLGMNPWNEIDSWQTYRASVIAAAQLKGVPV